MPLMIMTPNVAERDSPSRKRSHEEYSENVSGVQDKTVSQLEMRMEPLEMGTSIPPRLALTSMQSSPAQSSPAALTDTGFSTPAGGPASPNTPTRKPLVPVDPSAQNNSPITTQSPTVSPGNKITLPTGQGPPAKKQKKKTQTPEELAAKEQMRAAKEQERAAKEQAAAAKRAEREKAAQAKEQKKREKQEEEERKAKAQPKIAGFFAKKPATVPKAESSAAETKVKARSPSPFTDNTEYNRLAIPFFVHQSVRLANNGFAMDPKTVEAKTLIITEIIEGKRSPVPLRPFDPCARLNLATLPTPRGKSFPQVKDLISDQDGGMSNPIDLIAEALSLPTRESLKSIPMKQLSFHEDVRPGYYGTVTNVTSVATLKKMARNPVGKDLPLNYDYDSEAEWVQGDEEEDVEGIDDMTDDEEDEDDDKSIDEFLDDADDVRRGPLMTMGSMEPEVSGPWFEDRLRQNPNEQMYKMRMEFLIPNLEHNHSVDPFSSQYWPSSSASTSPGQARKSQTAQHDSNSAMPPPPAPNVTNGAAATTSADTPVKLVPAQDLADFKTTILDFKYLSKGALIPVLKHKFDRCTSGQIKATLEHVAEKPKARGDWQLKENA